MKSWKTLVLVSTMVLGMGLVAAGCSSNTSGSADKAEYVVGTDAAYAPFEWMENDKIVGYDVDVLNAVAEEAGIKLKWENTGWDGIFIALQNGERDIIASAVSITEERKKTFAFTDPYFEATQMLVFKDGENFKTLKDLEGKKIGVQNATTGDTAVSELFGQDNTNIKRFKTTPLALLELKNGGVDCVVADNGVVLEYVKKNGAEGLKTVIDETFEKEQYGFALKKEDTELLKKLNDGLAAIKDSGKLEDIQKQYGF
ncbi:MAG TPA: basic amino acid ABC transporter substrate-binding protein [Bacilli bacterium]|nr:basic amino acid ABC transporter substrate-binding protein [Bacilli bacterium]